MTELAYALYTAGLGLLLALYWPVALWRRRGRGGGTHIRERLGFYGQGPLARGAAWIHAVSVGETLAAAPLVDSLRRRHPEIPIVLTTVQEDPMLVETSAQITAVVR